MKEENFMKIFYHVDEDGKCAAFWVRKLAKHYDGLKREFIPINYGMEFPFDDIHPGEQVYIVDYSIFPEEMERLLKITKDVVWIDHHISAIQRYEIDRFKDMKIEGVRKNGTAGCMLTYLYLSGKYGDVGVEQHAPAFTKYIADYDVWKFEYGEASKKFEAGLSCYDLNPEGDIWKELFHEEKIEEVLSAGESILKYQDNWAKDYCEYYGFDTTFEGYKAFAMNLAMISSDYFKSVEGEYDLFIGFAFNGESWNYSLRSETVDCSKLAMKYGGGGHPGAAGFSTDELLVKKE